MAMIKCPECGKEYSDKAAACPNCGCPTEEAKKSAASEAGKATTAGTKKAAANKAKKTTGTGSSNGPTAKNGAAGTEKLMLDAVDRALEQARKANAKFQMDSEKVRAAARSASIDPNSNKAFSQVSSIVDDSLWACNDLYDANQRLVTKLDAECRPHLAGSPGAKAIRAVLGTIQLLNDASEINSIFSASLNGQDLGTAAVAKFRPTPGNEQIEGLWKAEYARLTDHTGAEAFWKQKQEEHSRLSFSEYRNSRIEELEIQKSIREAREEEERKKQEAEARKEKIREEYKGRYQEAYAKELKEKGQAVAKLEANTKRYDDLFRINDNLYTIGIAIGVVLIGFAFLGSEFVTHSLKIACIAAGSCIALLFTAAMLKRSSEMNKLKQERKDLEEKINDLENRIPPLDTFIVNERAKGIE